jgi:hypothetical protein
MKCIEMNGEVKRVSNEEAFELVGTGWKFCAKKVFKAKQGKVAKVAKPVSKDPVVKETGDKPEVPKNKYRQKKFDRGAGGKQRPYMEKKPENKAEVKA